MGRSMSPNVVISLVEVVVMSAGSLEELGAQLSSLGLLARINNSLLEGRTFCNQSVQFPNYREHSMYCTVIVIS